MQTTTITLGNIAPSQVLDRLLEGDIQKIAVLSHWIRTWYESHHSEPTLDCELVESIIKNERPPHPRQADNFIRWLGDNTEAGGDCIRRDILALEAIVGAASPGELLFVFNHLKAQGMVTGERHFEKTSDVTQIAATLSFPGWEYYRELKQGTTDSHVAFMAMQYDNAQLTEVFENVFKDAVDKTGFDLRRLVDMPQPAGLIDDDLRVKIQTSRFLIADLTDRNPGAYWEAGYAEGLGKHVIYTCRKDVFEDSKSCPHFDTNHHLTILWEWDADKRKEAGDKLKATIRATLPAEAKLTDD
ncbi:MAG: hypothetical protein FJ280_19825 [Planctomycetes bacterium]|nr:hypothetical protein [Planctomycetota bacterium]